MAQSQDPVVRNARRNLPQVVAYFGGLLAVAAMGLGITTYVKSENTQSRLEAAGPPCVDVKPKVRGVQPSRGCGRIFDLMASYCAEHRVFCLRSQRRAVRRAAAESVQHVIGPVAALPPAGGGGGSSGSNPRSPRSPSRQPQRGGGGGGGGTKPPVVTNPPTNGGGGGGSGGGQGQTTPDQTQKPLINLPDARETIKEIAPAVCTIPTPLGPIAGLCP